MVTQQLMCPVAVKRKLNHLNVLNRASKHTRLKIIFIFFWQFEFLIFRIPSKCHHENPHRCHGNDCPTCTQECMLPNTTTNCEHLCQVRCHDAVKIISIDKNFKPAGPWEKQVEKVDIF